MSTLIIIAIGWGAAVAFILALVALGSGEPVSPEEGSDENVG